MCATKYYGIAHLEIWKPSMALSNLLWSLASWFLHHLISKLANCEQNLLEIARYCLARSPECVVNHPEPLVITNNMKKYCGCRGYNRGYPRVGRLLELTGKK